MRTSSPSNGSVDRVDSVDMDSGSEGSISVQDYPTRPLRRPAHRNVARRRQDESWVVWTWNVPLLIGSLLFISLAAVVFTGLLLWQSSRLGGQFLQLAEVAQLADDSSEELRWLRRYLALRPADTTIQVRLARKLDDVADESGEIDKARYQLTRAIANLTDSDDQTTLVELRRRLIERLVQLGGGWLIEAERQINLLNPPADDPWALAMLARSLLGQEKAELTRQLERSNLPSRDQQYWRWAAAQPLGEVLRMAVEANPESVELTGALVGIYLDRPQLFLSENSRTAMTSVETSPEQLEQARTLLLKLSQKTADSHAQWLAYIYAHRHDIELSQRSLETVANEARERLKQQSQDVATTGLSSEADDEHRKWDVKLLLARGFEMQKAGDYAGAIKCYEFLTNLPVEIITLDQLELAFHGLGQTYLEQQDLVAAKMAWREGNEKLGGSSLMLLEPLVVHSVQSAPIKEVRGLLEDFKRAQEQTSLTLAGLAPKAIDQRQRDSLQAQLNAARWRIDVLQAQVDYREGKFAQATQQLERAIASQLQLEPSAKVNTARILATVYGEQNLWDLAGRVLSEAVQLAPADKDLRREAALAWQRASSPLRAAEQWKLADDGSFEAALAYAQNVAESFSFTAPVNRNFQTLRIAIERAKQRFDAAQHRPDQQVRLELLELYLPVALNQSGSSIAGKSDEAPVTPEAAQQLRAERLAELSTRYPQNAELQAIAALTLQQSGDEQAAQAAAERLRAIKDINPFVKLQFRVRFAGARGDHEQAIELLSQALGDENFDSVVVAKFAGSYLPSIGRPSAAIEILSTLTKDQHTPSSLFLLGELMLANLTSKELDSQPDVLSKLIAQLRELEGSDGTHWRLLLANSLIQQSAGGDINGPSNRQHLQAANKLTQEIIALRPRWARGYALAGRLAAAEGESRQAVEMLRRSLVEGDSRISTVLLLVEELNRIGDVAAAEQELSRLESMAAGNGRVSATAVGLAMGQKQYDRALQHARESVAARPKDARAHLLLAQTALVAARAEQRKLTQQNISNSASQANLDSTRSSGEAVQSIQQLRDEAQRSLELALQISNKGDLGVWMAHFRSQLENGGHQAARQVLESMSNSPLPDDVRFLATANGYLAVGDLAKVQQWLEQAKQVSPTDPQVALTEARLARLNGDHQQLLLALKEAYQLAPQSPDVRRRLALALAVAEPEEIPWEQIDDLIGTDPQDGSDVDELYHALIMINRGNTQQVDKAKNALRDMIARNSGQAKLDAIRLLLAAERRDWKHAVEAGDGDLAESSLEICRELYLTLVNSGTASPADLYGYGVLLKDADRDSEADGMLSRLVEEHSTDPLTLALTLELIPQQTEVRVIRDKVMRWLDTDPSSSSSVGKLSDAIQIMLKAGFADAAVALTEELYSAAPHHLQNYVFTLSETGQTDKIVEVCYLHYQETPSPLPVRLLAEAITQARSFKLITSKVDDMLIDSVSEFSTEVKMLESIGTLRMTEERYEEAIAIYLHTEKISPLSLVTLNNLAVSFSETPGSEHEAVSRAERVVQLYGRNPELLDTLGVAQLRAGQFASAEATLREACRQVSDPRYQLHLVQVLNEQGNRDEAQRIWAKLDKAGLAESALTPTDKKVLGRLKRDLSKTQET